MAGEITAGVEFTGIDNLSPVMRKISRKFNSAVRGMETGSARLSASFKRIQEHNKGLIRGFRRLTIVGAALGTAAFAKTLKTGADFQTSMADLSSITGITGDRLDELRKKSFLFAKEAVRGPAEVVEAFKLIGSSRSSLFENLDQFSDVTKNVLLLSNAAGIDLPTAVRVGVGALNQFKADSSEIGRFVNVLAAGSQIGASELGDLSQAFRLAGAVSANAGVSFEQTNSALQVLAQSELKGSEAGTGYKNVLLKLATASGKFAKFNLDKTGGLIPSLQLLAKEQLNATQMVKLFGLEGITAATALVNNADLVKEWAKQITGTNKATEQAEVRLSTFSKQAERAGVTLKVAMIKSFERLQPKLTDVAQRFGKWLDNLDEATINRFADSVGRFGSKLEDIFHSLGGLTGIIDKAKVAMEAFLLFKGAQTTIMLVSGLTSVATSTAAVGTAAAGATPAVAGLSTAFINLAAVVGALSFAATFAAMRKIRQESKLTFDVLSNVNPLSGLMNSITRLRFQNSGKLTEEQSDIRKKQTVPFHQTTPKAFLSESSAQSRSLDNLANNAIPSLMSEISTQQDVLKKPQKLSVDMRITAEGRPQVTRVDSNGPIDFSANTGQVTP